MMMGVSSCPDLAGLLLFQNEISILTANLDRPGRPESQSVSLATAQKKADA
jgi:hypothetical protein